MDRKALKAHFASVRELSEKLTAPLEIEDFVVQTGEDISPPKWHIGHTTWFFERVVLQEYEPGFKPFNEDYYFVFNSYYESFGERLYRPHRGTLSRPTVSQVMDYRKAITARTTDFMDQVTEDQWPEVAGLIELGIHHEQQHQELFVYDIKHILACNPLRPVYREPDTKGEAAFAPDLKWIDFEGGLHQIGAEPGGFAYDNEFPRHQVFTRDFKLANHPVTCGEYLEFIRDGGYQKALLWLSDGWARVQDENWRAPLYWEGDGEDLQVITLRGRKPVDPHEPVCHVSYFEATAFARWAGKRLPTEAEWECAAQAQKTPCECGSWLESETFHPVAVKHTDTGAPDTLHSMFGDVWEWTQSAYLPYPGYVQTFDALGEYNGKFMSNQMVLRGGSCATPRNHYRNTYRNFFQPEKQWPITGFRLAADA